MRVVDPCRKEYDVVVHLSAAILLQPKHNITSATAMMHDEPSVWLQSIMSLGRKCNNAHITDHQRYRQFHAKGVWRPGNALHLGASMSFGADAVRARCTSWRVLLALMFT